MKSEFKPVHQRAEASRRHGLEQTLTFAIQGAESLSWSTARRTLVAGMGLVGAHLRPGAVAAALLWWPGRGHSRDGEQSATLALQRLRLFNATPAWFTSGNWGNGRYRPWTDYLVGRMGEAEFEAVCAAPSDYCLRDVWNLRQRLPGPIQWAREEPGFNWPGIHALAMRYFRTGEAIYLEKWVAVVSDFANWTLQRPIEQRTPLERGQPGPLLESAMTWGGILTAMGILAKGLEGASLATASPFASRPGPVPGGPHAAALGRALSGIAAAFSRGDAAFLARHYASPRYVPNQRVYGLEALLQMGAFFPDLSAGAWLTLAHEAMHDAAERYSLPDGGQVEQSFNYAQALVQSLERCTWLPFETEPAWRAAARTAVRRWEWFVAALAVPTGGLPQLGNTSWGRVGRQQAAAVRPVGPSVALPYSGLYVMRSDWTPQSPYLFFVHRRAARGHQMAGGNSVQVSAFGRPLLAAGGSAVYGGPAARDAALTAYLSESSSWKTCTVLVDGRSQAGASFQGLALGSDGKPDITRAPAAPARVRWHTSDALDVLESDYREGYRATLDDPRASLVSDVVHTRRVIFVRPMALWLVVDVMRTQAAHDYTQVWKFLPPNTEPSLNGFEQSQVEVQPRERRISTRDATPLAANVDLLHFGPPELQYRRFFGAQGLGWHNPGPLTRPEPAVDVHASWRGTGSQVLLTAIVPRRGTASPVTRVADLSRAATAGCALVNDEGMRLSVLATASPIALAIEGTSAECELLLTLGSPGQRPEKLLLSSDESWHFSNASHNVKHAVTVPTRVEGLQ